MKQVTLSDVRNTLYSMLRRAPLYLSDDQLLAADFWYDLDMDEQNILIMIVSLQRSLHIYLPSQVMDSLQKNNTVKTFLLAANQWLEDLDEQ